MKRPSLSLAILATAATLGAAAPVAAFELFGYRLWGKSEEEEDSFEVIDPLPFTVEVEVSGGSNGLARSLESASALWRGQDLPASGRGGLLAQARGDYRRILAALYDNAYYGGEISILLAGREAADLTLDSPMPATVPVTIRIRPGPRFHFGQAAIVNPPPRDVGENDVVENEEADKFRRGEEARAGVISAASATAVERWRQVGHAKAREAERSVIADHPTTLLDVSVTLDPGMA
jgi:translocation and assembly module TamA